MGARYPVVGISIIYSMHKSLRLKGIVKAQKRGVESDIIRTVMTSHTIADVFFLGTLKGILSGFKSQKNQFERLGPKKGGVCFDGAYVLSCVKRGTAHGFLRFKA